MNQITGWSGPIDPIAYARMFRRTVAVARRADPAARFMLAADTGSATGDWPEPPFLGAMLDAFPDLDRYADIVSLHPYTSEVPPRRCTPDEDEPGYRDGSPKPAWTTFVDQIREGLPTAPTR